MLKDNTSVQIDGRKVTIRPIRPNDVALEADFVHRLSLLTKHYRFFGAVKELPVEEVTRLCTVDGRQSMAYVATINEGGHEVEIGVCRYAPASVSDAREMAVTIADKWQKTDLAQVLVRHLMASAKRQGVRELHAIELSDNRAMHDFAKDLGMSALRDPADATQVIYSLRL
jgi:RimJ/RimL family protein N-acetyltransferase